MLACALMLFPQISSAEDIILTYESGMDNQVTVTHEDDGSMTVVTSGGDPFFMLSPLSRDLNEDETVVTVEYQASASVPDGTELFFSPIAGGREIFFDGGFSFTEEGVWRKAYMDITKARTDMGWGSKGDFMRFDVGNQGGVTYRFRNICITTPHEYDRTEVVKIGTAEEMEAFMNRINNDFEYAISAELTADIDFTGHSTRISRLEGTLDGTGHTLTIDYDTKGAYAAPVEMLYGTVKNLTVKGTIATTQKYAGGIAGSSKGGTIRNCVSLVDILPTIEGDGTHGGFVGISSSGVTTIDNCIFAGSIKSEVTTNCAGFIGWTGAASNVSNCVQAGVIDIPESDTKVWGRCPQNFRLTNGYYLNMAGTSNETGGIQVTEEMLTNGALCFLLNGDQSAISWTQDLGTDPYPLPTTTHKQVYANGELTCAGKPVGEITYSNTPSESVIPDHQFEEDGICSVCGTLNINMIEPDAEGFLPIATGKQLLWFAHVVGTGKRDIKGRLTADIDMTDIPFEPIGVKASPFIGTFDGGMHRISGLNISKPETDFVGLFGAISGGFEISNLVLADNCYIEGKGFVGLVGGSTGGGTATFTNIGNEGSVVATAQNGAGIVGCSEGSSCRFLLTNCYVTGSITGATEAAAFCGWTGNQGSKLTNCWTISSVEGTNGDNVYCARGEKHTFTNCYSVNGTQVNKISEEAVASGELCYKVNGGSILNPTFYQTIGQDEFPVFDDTHGIVYTADGETYNDIHDDASFKEFVNWVLEADNDLLNDIVANAELIAQYTSELAVLKSLNDRDAFIQQYASMAGLKQQLLASKAAYAEYDAKMQEISDFITSEGLTGPTTEKLESYLMEDFEPNEDFPNGSYQYIMAQHTLDNEQLAAETATIEEMLKVAISEGFGKDADITSLLMNPEFINGFGGWEGKTATGYGDNGNMHAAECYNTTFDMYQTLTGLQNGVYELQVNGAFRPANDRYSTNLAASIYANGNEMYLPAVIDEMISVKDAVDLENCWIGANAQFRDLEIMDETGTELLGYALHGVQSSCYAFQAGRCSNSIVANVTDGTLTVGIKSPGTGVSGDWTGFGNIRLIYRGALDEASEGMNGTLACAVARANTLLNYAYDPIDLKAKPNFSDELRDRLNEAVENAAAASTAQEKYALVEEFSDIFRSVYACKKSYLKLALLVDKIYEAYATISTEDEDLIELINRVEKISAEVWAGYEGAYTQEEAEAKYEELRKEFKTHYTTPAPEVMANNINVSVIEPFAYRLECLGGDPYVAMSALEEDLAPEVTYITFEYRSATDIRGEIFYSPIAAGRNLLNDWLYATDEWTRAFIDISAARTKLSWGKAGDYIRWDVVNDGYDVLDFRFFEYVTEEGKEDLLTRINSVSDLSPMAPADQNTYTMDGKMFRPGTSLRNLPAGLYIIGGKKYLVK